MDVSITSIEVGAFKAFVEPAHLSIANFPHGLHMVRGRNLTNADHLGSNGAGKSTFFSDAVTWCLYGRTTEGLRTTDVKSWLTDAAPRGAVGLSHIQEEVSTIVRGPRANDLTINDSAVGQDDVDKLVGLSYAAWCQAIVFGQGRPLFFDLAPAAKMDLLSEALGLERWERRAEAAGGRAKRLSERLTSVQGELRGLETAAEHARAAAREARQAAAAWGQERASRLAELTDALKSARGLARSLEVKRGEAALAADSAGTAIKLLRPDVDATRAELGQTRAEAQNAHTQAAATRAELATAEEALEAFVSAGVCPTCGQKVAKKDAAVHARGHRAQIKRLNTLLKDVEDSGARHTRHIDELKARLAEDEQRLSDLERTFDRAQGEQRLYERELGAAQVRAGTLESSVADVEREENPHRGAERDARVRLREIEQTLKESEDLVHRLEASVERAQFWAKGFREIRLGIVDDFIDDLRATTAEVLDGLGVGDWEVEYATERETKSGSVQRALTVAVRSPAAPAGVRWELYSGGERQRLRLAGALALSEVLLSHAGTHLDFRVLDEPTRGLSPEGVRALVEVLGDYAERAGLRIFYVDHHSQDGLAFAGSVEVECDGQGRARLRAQ